MIHYIALRDPADGLLRGESVSRFRAADGYVIRYVPSEGGFLLTHPAAPGVVRGVPLSNVVFWHTDQAPEPVKPPSERPAPLPEPKGGRRVR